MIYVKIVKTPENTEECLFCPLIYKVIEGER